MSNSTTDAVAKDCAAIFRDLSGLSHAPAVSRMSDGELLAQPMESFEIDSLTVMEFVMAVEDRFGVELNELAVTRCRTIGDLAGLVRQARGV